MRTDIIQKVFKKVYGKPAWLVRKGYGTSITFEFGRPRLTVLKKVFQPNKKAGRKYRKRPAHIQGDWHLWIYCCDWEIRQDGRKISHSKSDSRNVDRACGVLNGQILTKIVMAPRTLQTAFHFDLGGYLRTTRYRGEPIEMWNIRCPNGHYLCVRADGKYSYQPGNTPVSEKHWLSLGN